MLKDSYIVEKSTSLVWAKLRDYGAGQLKILDTYLSRINARDPASSRVTFTRKEYAALMGLDADIRTSQLKEYTRGLLGNVVTIDLPGGTGYDQYPLFTEAKCYFSDERNQTVVTIDCNPALKQAFFNIAQDGYVRYQLKNVIALKSQYSIRLYSMLKARPFGWTIGLDELKELLGATSSTYAEFKRFNDLILKKAVAEINEMTDINVEVERIRKGRTVVSLKFIITNSTQAIPPVPEPAEIVPDEDPFEEEEDEPNLFDFQQEDDPCTPYKYDPLDLLMEDLPRDFTREQAQVIRDAAMKHLPYEVTSFGEKDLWISDYVQSKVRLMKAQNPPVTSKYGWLRKAVAEDWQ